MNTFRRIVLIISGVLLLIVGIMILLFPHSFYASNGVILGEQAGLLSEIRATGGLFAGCGIILIIGAIRQNIMRSALILAALIFGTLGVARLFSFLIDGMPGSSIAAAAFLEIIIGTLCAVLIPGVGSGLSATETAAKKGQQLRRSNYGID
ncbi:MAG: DUF4345 domain-containing protein [Pyrinomonadaceae bacterium]